jgi:polyhydroxyalkanoate synthesis regulator phasin
MEGARTKAAHNVITSLEMRRKEAVGVLTEHLTQLRNEILALRSARQELTHALQRETEGRRADVTQMLANFSSNLGAVVGRTKADRLGSISDLRRTVNRLQTEVHTELSGVRQAWRALGTPSRGAVEKFESQATLGAMAGVEGSQSETGGRPPLAHVGGEKPARKKRKH